MEMSKSYLEEAGSCMAKLIILRGPSGAGKSTVAKRLHETSTRRIALIEQDYYREQLLNNGEGAKETSKQMRLEMFETDIQIALKHNFDVIVEGILNPQTYVPVFERIRQSSQAESYMFYFDVSFEETAQRHINRDKAKLFSADEMKEWYHFAQRSGLEWEVIIPEESTLEETIANIRATTGI